MATLNVVEIVTQRNASLLKPENLICCQGKERNGLTAEYPLHLSTFLVSSIGGAFDHKYLKQLLVLFINEKHEGFLRYLLK